MVPGTCRATGAVKSRAASPAPPDLNSPSHHESGVAAANRPGNLRPGLAGTGSRGRGLFGQRSRQPRPPLSLATGPRERLPESPRPHLRFDGVSQHRIGPVAGGRSLRGPPPCACPAPGGGRWNPAGANRRVHSTPVAETPFRPSSAPEGSPTNSRPGRFNRRRRRIGSNPCDSRPPVPDPLHNVRSASHWAHVPAGVSKRSAIRAAASKHFNFCPYPGARLPLPRGARPPECGGPAPRPGRARARSPGRVPGEPSVHNRAPHPVEFQDCRDRRRSDRGSRRVPGCRVSALRLPQRDPPGKPSVRQG